MCVLCVLYVYCVVCVMCRNVWYGCMIVSMQTQTHPPTHIPTPPSPHTPPTQDVVSQRRTPELEKLPMATSKQGTYIWLGGEPQAGQQVQLLYNRNNGNLRHSQSVSVHVGYDGWWMMDKRVYKMSKLSNEEVC